MTPLAWRCGGELVPGGYFTSTRTRSRAGSPGSSCLITSRRVGALTGARCWADATSSRDVEVTAANKETTDARLKPLRLTAGFIMAFLLDRPASYCGLNTGEPLPFPRRIHVFVGEFKTGWPGRARP